MQSYYANECNILTSWANEKQKVTNNHLRWFLNKTDWQANKNTAASYKTAHKKYWQKLKHKNFWKHFNHKNVKKELGDLGGVSNSLKCDLYHKGEYVFLKSWANGKQENKQNNWQVRKNVRKKNAQANQYNEAKDQELKDTWYKNFDLTNRRYAANYFFDLHEKEQYFYNKRRCTLTALGNNQVKRSKFPKWQMNYEKRQANEFVWNYKRTQESNVNKQVVLSKLLVNNKQVKENSTVKISFHENMNAEQTLIARKGSTLRDKANQIIDDILSGGTGKGTLVYDRKNDFCNSISNNDARVTRKAGIQNKEVFGERKILLNTVYQKYNSTNFINPTNPRSHKDKLAVAEVLEKHKPKLTYRSRVVQKTDNACLNMDNACLKIDNACLKTDNAYLNTDLSNSLGQSKWLMPIHEYSNNDWSKHAENWKLSSEPCIKEYNVAEPSWFWKDICCGKSMPGYISFDKPVTYRDNHDPYPSAIKFSYLPLFPASNNRNLMETSTVSNKKEMSHTCLLREINFKSDIPPTDIPLDCVHMDATNGRKYGTKQMSLNIALIKTNEKEAMEQNIARDAIKQVVEKKAMKQDTARNTVVQDVERAIEKGATTKEIRNHCCHGNEKIICNDLKENGIEGKDVDIITQSDCNEKNIFS